MAIEKKIEIDRIEIVGEHRIIQVRLRVDILEDGVVVGRLPAGRLAPKYPGEDVTLHKDVAVGKGKMPVPEAAKQALLQISEVVWTPDVVTQYEAAKRQKKGLLLAVEKDVDDAN